MLTISRRILLTAAVFVSWPLCVAQGNSDVEPFVRHQEGSNRIASRKITTRKRTELACPYSVDTWSEVQTELLPAKLARRAELVPNATKKDRTYWRKGNRSESSTLFEVELDSFNKFSKHYYETVIPPSLKQ